MTRAQRVVILIGLLVIAAMALYPPWTHPPGYHPLWSTPHRRDFEDVGVTQIYYVHGGRLQAQVLAVAAITAALALLLGCRKRQPSDGCEEVGQVKAARPDYARHATTVIGLVVIIYLPALAIDPAVSMALVATAALGAGVLWWGLRRYRRPFSVEPFLAPILGLLTLAYCALLYPPSPYGYDPVLLVMAATTASGAFVLWIMGRKRPQPTS